MTLSWRDPGAADAGASGKSVLTENTPSFIPSGIAVSMKLRVSVGVAVSLKARLHPRWVGGRDGYRYSVIHAGKLLVDGSRDPACDAARALLAKGITGMLTLLDGTTGRPRSRRRYREGGAPVREGGTIAVCALREPSQLTVQPREGCSQTSQAPWREPGLH